MKSVGEAMAIGRTFQQAFAKAMRSPRARQRAGLRRARPRRAARPRSSARPPTATSVLLEAFRRGATVEEVHERDAHRPVVPARAARRSRSTPRRRSRGERSFKAVDTCAAEFAARTPYYYSGWERARRRTRSSAATAPSVVILGAGPEPHRPGHRVRLLLRARRDDRPRVRPRRGDDQLQPGDGLDRLRHLRPPVLRAADARGRARRRRGRAARGRDRPVRRPDAAEARRRPAATPACRCSGTSVDAIDLAEDRGRFGALLERLGYEAPPYATARGVERGARGARDVGFPLLVRPELRARRPRDGDRLLRRRPARLPARATRRAATGTGARSSSTASSRTRSRSTSTRCATARTSGSAGSCSTSRRPAIHSGDRACVLPPHSLGARDARPRSASATRGIALGARRRRAAQRPVRGPRRRALRDRGQPARVADGAVRLEGDRHAAGQDGLPDHARRADRRPRPARRPDARATTSSVKEAVLPFDRFEGSDAVLGPGDALDRRGDGRRARLPDRVRQGAGRGRRRAAARRARPSSPSPTPTRPAPSRSPQTLHDLGFRIVATRGHRRGDRAAWGSRSRALNKIGEGSPHVVDWIERGDVDLVINTPDRLGRPHRRLGDPPRRRRARDPVPDDAVGRRSPRPARSPPRASGDAGGAVAAGAPRAGARGPRRRA